MMNMLNEMKWNKNWKFTNDEEKTVHLMNDIMDTIDSDRYLITIDEVVVQSKINEELVHLLMDLEVANRCIAIYSLQHLNIKGRIGLAIEKILTDGATDKKEIMKTAIEEIIKFYDEEGEEIERTKKAFAERIEKSKNTIEQLDNYSLTREERKIKKIAIKYFKLLQQYHKWLQEVEQEAEEMLGKLEEEDE